MLEVAAVVVATSVVATLVCWEWSTTFCAVAPKLNNPIDSESASTLVVIMMQPFLGKARIDDSVRSDSQRRRDMRQLPVDALYADPVNGNMT